MTCGKVLKICLLAGLASGIFLSCRPEQQAVSKEVLIQGPYFGLRPPGNTAELFAPGIISAGGMEILAVFSPDHKECFYSTVVPRFGGCILQKKTDALGNWREPEVASFSGMYSDFGSSLSPDGKKFYFVSDRPLKEGEERNMFQDIWVVEKDASSGNWGQPYPLDAPVNSEARDLGPCVLSDGTLYFNSNRPGAVTGNQMDIYRCRWEDDYYGEPENMGALLGLNYDNFEAALPLDGSFLIFVALEGPEHHGEFDLYISFPGEDGTWSPPLNLGSAVNTSANEHFPTISPDGKYLFFVSDRVSDDFSTRRQRTYAEIIQMEKSTQNGNSDIYWISTAAIRGLYK